MGPDITPIDRRRTARTPFGPKWAWIKSKRESGLNARPSSISLSRARRPIELAGARAPRRGRVSGDANAALRMPTSSRVFLNGRPKYRTRSRNVAESSGPETSRPSANTRTSHPASISPVIWLSMKVSDKLGNSYTIAAVFTPARQLPARTRRSSAFIPSEQAASAPHFIKDNAGYEK